jgi:hypothetical protein
MNKSKGENQVGDSLSKVGNHVGNSIHSHAIEDKEKS